MEAIALADDGLVPNNARFALRLYRGAGPAEVADAAKRWIALFARNGWSGAWINCIYPFHHYHATVHEVLGLARGAARVQFGGPSGPIVDVSAGDAVLIPAGVGHCRIDASADLSVVGAYPDGADWDLQRATPEARLAALPLIAGVSQWPRAPVTGVPTSAGPT